MNLNSEQLRPVYNWFVHHLQIISDRGLDFPIFTINYIKDNNNKEKTLQMLKAADFQIADIKIETQKVQQFNFKLESGKPSVPIMEEAELPRNVFA